MRPVRAATAWKTQKIKSPDTGSISWLDRFIAVRLKTQLLQNHLNGHRGRRTNTIWSFFFFVPFGQRKVTSSYGIRLHISRSNLVLLVAINGWSSQYRPGYCHFAKYPMKKKGKCRVSYRMIFLSKPEKKTKTFPIIKKIIAAPEWNVTFAKRQVRLNFFMLYPSTSCTTARTRKT